MNRPSDEVAGVLADLLTWLRQNDTPAGDGYFLQEAAPGSTTRPAASPSTSPSTSATSAAAPHSAPGPAAAAAPATAPAPADSPFAASCAAFVQDTLGLIRRHRQADLVLPLAAPAPAVSAAPAAPGDRALALEALRQEVLPCTACGLHESRRNVVFGSGSPQARLVFVGEAPGQEEDRQGQPFVGRSGQLLTKILEAIAFAREDVFICNILKCRPPENRDPLPHEVASCEPHLQRQLAILQPRLICCLGRIAAQTLLKTDASLGRLREAVHFYRGIPVLVTFHPAYLLRNPAAKRDAWDDVRRLRALYDALGADPSADPSADPRV